MKQKAIFAQLKVNLKLSIHVYICILCWRKSNKTFKCAVHLEFRINLDKDKNFTIKRSIADTASPNICETR